MAAHFSIQQVSGHTPTPDEVIAAFAARQHGLVTLIQLLAAGLVHSQVNRRVAAGRLAAALGAGEGSVLSHLSLAELHAISRFRSPLLAVLSPRRRALEGVKVHRYRTLDPRDATTHKNIPVTTVHRLFVDLTDVLTAHQLTNVIYEAAFRGRWVEPASRDAMRRANGRHKLHVLNRAIELYNSGSAGTRSGAEDAFLALDFPEPIVNTEFEGFEVDFRWPQLKLSVEVDGAHHGRPRSKLHDAREERTLQAAGYTLLRFADTDVYERPRCVLEALHAHRP